MTIIFKIISAGLISTILLSSCEKIQTTNNSQLGANRKQFFSVSEQEIAQGVPQAYEGATGKYPRSTNTGLVQRVQHITNKLIANVPHFRPDAKNWPWEIRVLESPEKNAFCMPMGKMAIYTGIITKLNLTDDEIAMIMGHEIAHALKEHSREQASQQMVTGTAMQIGSAILSGLSQSNGTAGAIGQIGGQVVNNYGGVLSNVTFLLPKSRKHELEADALGTELAFRAGYNPNASVSLWEKMEQSENNGQPASSGGVAKYFSTHPHSQDRLTKLKNAAQILLQNRK